MSSGNVVEGTKCPAFPEGWPKDADISNYSGGCHCGMFRYEFNFPSLETTHIISCNCSSCSIKGALIIHVPKHKFQLTQGTLNELSQYQYNKKVVTHYFCPSCGSQLVVMGLEFDFVAVNINTTSGIDPSKLNIEKVDGRSR